MSINKCYPSQTQARLNLRIPSTMMEQIKMRAERNGRAFNSEVMDYLKIAIKRKSCVSPPIMLDIFIHDLNKIKNQLLDKPLQPLELREGQLNIVTIPLRFNENIKEEIEMLAKNNNQSLNQFIIDLIDSTINFDLNTKDLIINLNTIITKLKTKRKIEMTELKKISVIIPSHVQEKIQNGEWELDGSIVKKSKGKQIMAHLESLTVHGDQSYTPSYFSIYQDNVFLSMKCIAEEIRKYFYDNNKKFTSIDMKLDEIISNSRRDLIGELNYFFSSFEHLQKDNDEDAFHLIRDGAKTAAKLAQYLEPFLNQYVDEIVIYHNSSIHGEVYRNFRQNKNNRSITVSSLKYPNFASSQLKFFLYSFMELINEINILELCYKKRNNPDYKNNLSEMRRLMVNFLRTLVYGIRLDARTNNSLNYLDMCFKKNRDGKAFGNSQVERLVRYLDDLNVESLAMHNFGQSDEWEIKQDENLRIAISDVLDIIEDIDNLIQRAEPQEMIDEEYIDALGILKDITFKAK